MQTDKIGIIPLPNKPNPDVVEICEDLLRDAKSGKMRAIAVVWVNGDNQGMDCIRVYRGNSWYSHLIGGMYILMQNLANEILHGG